MELVSALLLCMIGELMCLPFLLLIGLLMKAKVFID